MLAHGLRVAGAVVVQHVVAERKLVATLAKAGYVQHLNHQTIAKAVIHKLVAHGLRVAGAVVVQHVVAEHKPVATLVKVGHV